jgi:hypothetical protein
MKIEFRKGIGELFLWEIGIEGIGLSVEWV